PSASAGSPPPRSRRTAPPPTESFPPAVLQHSPPAPGPQGCGRLRPAHRAPPPSSALPSCTTPHSRSPAVALPRRPAPTGRNVTSSVLETWFVHFLVILSANEEERVIRCRNPPHRARPHSQRSATRASLFLNFLRLDAVFRRRVVYDFRKLPERFCRAIEQELSDILPARVQFKSRSSVRFTRVCTPGSSRSHAIEVVEFLRKLSSSDQPIDKLANTRLPCRGCSGRALGKTRNRTKIRFLKKAGSMKTFFS